MTRKSKEGYYGVKRVAYNYRGKNVICWQAYTRVRGRHIYIRTCGNPEMAAAAYNEYIEKNNLHWFPKN